MKCCRKKRRNKPDAAFFQIAGHDVQTTPDETIHGCPDCHEVVSLITIMSPDLCGSALPIKRYLSESPHGFFAPAAESQGDSCKR